MHLTIDGRRFRNCPFILLDIPAHSAILGIRWLRRFQILLDPSRNRLVWPSHLPPNRSFLKEIKLRKFTQVGPKRRITEWQSDMIRRDQAIAVDEVRRTHSKLEIPVTILDPELAQIKPETPPSRPLVPKPIVPPRTPRSFSIL